jgi:hypothetical protein
VERRYYTAASLESVVSWFEKEYGLSSEEFRAAHLASELPASIPGFHRHTWASFCRELDEHEEFGHHAERVLAGH